MANIPHQRGPGGDETGNENNQDSAAGGRAEVMEALVRLIREIVRDVRERSLHALVCFIQAALGNHGGAMIVCAPKSGHGRFEVHHVSEGLLPLIFGRLDGHTDGSAK